jgi:hypothetical protein
MRSACLGGVRLGHFGMSPWGKRKAAPLRCAPDRVLLRVMLLVVPIDNNQTGGTKNGTRILQRVDTKPTKRGF